MSAVPEIGRAAIQIDIDPEALGRNYPVVACVNGDAKVTLTKMRELADGHAVACHFPLVRAAGTTARSEEMKETPR